MKTIATYGLMVLCMLTGCNPQQKTQEKPVEQTQKIVIYQVFTRLFGNTDTTHRAWGTIEENGAGKFNDFTDEALEAIRELGVTHIWYTGVLHHAMVTDYSTFGLPGDDPDVVKGRAGSPYAVKDYYNVDPDLAVDPFRRMEEFEALVVRTHRHGMKVIIDIVPNHVARVYHSVSDPEGVEDFGASDDRSVVYRRDNNFYYIPGEPFRVPEWKDGYLPLGGEKHPLADGFFYEYPARWTGNGTRSPQPDMYDWYETVKINFGVRPDGTKDFPGLPGGFESEPVETHFAFWKDKDVPDSWKKFHDIAMFWLDKGVDGFRYDMAQMVPVEFWSYLNSAIKTKRPDAILVSEIYIPEMYRDYINLGKMDYLYDKVQLYDTLKSVIRGHGSTDQLVQIRNSLADIEHHMLHFMENHDEQRIASEAFAGDARKGKPAMVVSAAIGTSPVMVYFAQELGEPAEGNPGFGSPSRTTIYDYWDVPSHVRWVNNGAFDGGQLTEEEKALREFYRRLLQFTLESRALTGDYREIHSHNRAVTEGYSDRLFSWVRWKDEDRLVVVVNFDAGASYGFDLQLPEDLVQTWQLKDGSYILEDRLGGPGVDGKQRGLGMGEVQGDQHTDSGTEGHGRELVVKNGNARVRIELRPLESLVLGFSRDM
jgi:glycosidase